MEHGSSIFLSRLESLRSAQRGPPRHRTGATTGQDTVARGDTKGRAAASTAARHPTNCMGHGQQGSTAVSSSKRQRTDEPEVILQHQDTLLHTDVHAVQLWEERREPEGFCPPAPTRHGTFEILWTTKSVKKQFDNLSAPSACKCTVAKVTMVPAKVDPSL